MVGYPRGEILVEPVRPIVAVMGRFTLFLCCVRGFLRFFEKVNVISRLGVCICGLHRRAVRVMRPLFRKVLIIIGIFCNAAICFFLRK